MYPRGTETGQSKSLPAEQTAESGISSVLQGLTSEVEATTKLAYSVRAALGIAAPENEGKDPKQAASLRDVLQTLRRQLVHANQDFETVINHINS
jgi:hypothetical protein